MIVRLPNTNTNCETSKRNKFKTHSNILTSREAALKLMLQHLFSEGDSDRLQQYLLRPPIVDKS